MALYSAPAVPNYTAAATQDVTTARPNQQTPWGSTTWVPPTTPGGQWTQNTTLNSNEQGALTGQQQTDKNLSVGAAAKTPWAVSAGSAPMDYSKFMAGGGRVNGGNYYDQKAGDAVYQQFSDRMEPQFQRDTAAAETQMRNQGLSPGDEAWNDQMRQLQQSQGDQREQAMRDATSTAATEGSRMQGMDVSAGNYDTSQRESQIAQELQKRGYGVDEINAMLSGHGVGMPNMPATPGQGSQYTTALGDTYGAQLDSSNAKNASTGSWLNLAGKVGSKVLDKYGGTILDKAGSWLGFNPADATALSSAASQAGAAGLTDMGASAAANAAALPGVDMGITASSLTPAASAAAPASGAVPAAGGSWLGAAGGVAGGLAAIASVPVLANYMDKHHTMTPQDYLKQWGGQNVKNAQEAKDALARGDTAGYKAALARTGTLNAISGMTKDELAGKSREGAYITTNKNSSPSAIRRSF